MTSHPNALLALQNAWTGLMKASDRVRDLAPTVLDLAPDAEITEAHFDTLHGAALAQANAAAALQGLIEQLQRLKTRNA